MLSSLILKNIWARRTRSLLTALGIGISIAFIITIISLADNFKGELNLAAQITEADLVAVQRGLAGPTGGSIPESYVEDIEGYEGVEGATGCVLVSLSLPGVASFTLFGVLPEQGELYVSDDQLKQGRLNQNPGEIGLGETAKDNLGLKVGEILRLEAGQEFTVSGIYRTGNSYADNGGVISLEEAQAIAGREGKVTLIAIHLKPGVDKDEIIEQIEVDKQYVKVVTFPELLGTSSSVELADTFALVLFLIAIIMGCIGVMNTMSMSVSERTREIGILKAIGWSRFKVLSMVLGESLLLAVVGFAIGSLLAMGTIWILTSLPAVKGFIDLSFSGDSFLIGFLVALILGILGGALPVYRASRLSPTEALRYE